MAAVDIASVPRIGRREAPGLAAEEYRRLADLARDLSADDWARPTDCQGWTVREIVAHVAGQMAGTAFREGARQRRLARDRSQRSGRRFLDEMNEVQIEERADLTLGALTAELRDRIPTAVEPPEGARPPATGTRPGRRTAHAPRRGSRRDLDPQPVDAPHRHLPGHGTSAAPDGRPRRAVGRRRGPRLGRPAWTALHPAADRAGRRRVRAPPGGPEIALDAVELCRALSARSSAEGLLATPVTF